MATISGQKVVAAAGAAVILGNQLINGPLLIKALDTNVGVVAVGNDGANDVTVANGLRLLKNEEIPFVFVGNLANLWLDSTVNGEGVSWLELEV